MSIRLTFSFHQNTLFMGACNTCFVGLDVSKGYVDIMALDEKKRRLEPSFQLDDNAEGHEKFRTWIVEQAAHWGALICGVENTGGYEEHWVDLVKGLRKDHEGLEIHQVNPKAVKHQRQSLLKRTVTDGVSAEAIAVYLANNHEHARKDWERSTYAGEGLEEVQRLHQMILGRIKYCTSEKNRLEKLVYKTFPELLTHCRQGVPDWLLRLLKEYPTAERVERAKESSLSRIKGISAQKAERLKAQARVSVAGPQGAASELMVRELSKTLLDAKKRTEELKRKLIELYRDPNKELVTSIRGIGEWTACTLLIQLGAPERFDDANKLAAFFGVHPVFKESGDGHVRGRMSKQGRSQMRTVLFNAANSVVLHEPYFKELYAHHRQKGKKHKAVIGIIMHKLLRVIHGMLRKQEPFDPQKDRENQKRSERPEKEAKNIAESSRKYQELSTDAPISRSNYKKRRADMECQGPTRGPSAASSKSDPEDEHKKGSRKSGKSTV